MYQYTCVYIYMYSVYIKPVQLNLSWDHIKHAYTGQKDERLMVHTTNLSCGSVAKHKPEQNYYFTALWFSKKGS